MSQPATTPPRRRLVPFQQAAKHVRRSERTLRRWASQGRITVYRTGPTAYSVDLNELDAMLRITPRTQARDGRKPFGPDARVVDLSNVVLPAQDSGR